MRNSRHYDWRVNGYTLIIEELKKAILCQLIRSDAEDRSNIPAWRILETVLSESASPATALSPITLVIVAAAKETKKENVKAAFHPTKKRINEHQLFSTKSFSNRKMRDMSSKFIEILDPNDTRPRMSDCDVRLEDVLADHEALVTRPRSSTQSSSKPSLDNRLDRDSPTSPTQRWKRLSTILVPARRGSA
ncbi:hypothetical protein RIB2604_00401750 [Aspergillus luchuensis]|nr:hypothetical protein RIB2604_00401750 [Aspergillus luchuensis]